MKNIKSVVSYIIIFVFLFQISAPNIAYAYVNSQNTVRGSNTFIEYLMDKNDGRFIVRTVSGAPTKKDDNNKKLLFERNNDPETSFTTFRVNGEDYIFGNGYLGHSEKVNMYSMSTDGKYTTQKWNVDGLDITQTLEIIEDPEHPNVGNVRIRYEVVNKSGVSKSIGSRIFLDTQMGSNDAASFTVGEEVVIKEKEFTGANIPAFYRTNDNQTAPSVIGYGFLKGWGNIEPDKLVLGHYNTLSSSKWDVTIDNNLDFTKKMNKYGDADSAAAYYWNPKALAPNASRVYETFYGLGDFSHYNSNSPYQVMVTVPEKLTVNPSRNGYIENEMTVSVMIDNSQTNSKNLTAVKIELTKNELAFEDVAGEDYTKIVPLIAKGAVKTYEFKVKPIKQNKFVSEPINVSVTSNNNETPVSGYDYVLMPNISGALPQLTLESILPQTVYYTGYRDFSIKGKGFSMLSERNLWKLFLVNSSGVELEIPDANITIENDEKMKIVIYENTFETTTAAGEYTFKIVHSGELGTIKTPKDKAVVFSKDKKYMSRPYGVFYIEKVAVGNSFRYDMKTTGSAEQLKTLKNTKNIIFDVVGDVIETTNPDTTKQYKINTESKSAIINSVVQYKDANEPLVIKKTGDMITIEGDGTLQIVSGNEFWWSSFYTYIADGEDYVINEVLEEPAEGEPEETRSNLVIDFFNPINAVGAIANTMYDGFNVEIKSVILLDEGASFGGKVEIKVPFGESAPEEKEEKSEEEVKDTMSDAISDMFLTDKERKDKKEDGDKDNAYLQIKALLLTNDEINDKIEELKNYSSATPAQKSRTILNLILATPELFTTVFNAVNGNDSEEEEEGKSVGVKIDVKKVILGKKYGDDFLYDSVKYIGLAAEGEVNVTLPFGADSDDDDAQGIKGKVVVNTIDGEYSIEADVNLEIVNAHALVSIVKVGNKLIADDVVLSGGFEPGVPIIPPLFINQVGGGAENIAGKVGSGPLTIIIILGLSLSPIMEGEFNLATSKNGFTLKGDLELTGGIDILKSVSATLQWVHPYYLEAEATVDLFECIEGTANVFIGETQVSKDEYEFYFEGSVKASIQIPKDIWFIGGIKLASGELGLNTEKIWGNVKVIGIGVGVTYVYGKSVSIKLADAKGKLASLTNLGIPESAIYEKKLVNPQNPEEEVTIVVGSNIRKVGSSNAGYASTSIEGLGSYVVANAQSTDYNFVVNNLDNSLIELKFTGEIPNITLKDPNGNNVPLVENTNYMVRVVAPEDSESGLEEKYIYISMNNPVNGTWKVTSNKKIEVGNMFEAKSLPELNTLDFTQNGETINVNFTASNTTDALVSIFMVDASKPDEAGYAIASNIAADAGSVSVKIPKGAKEGTYVLRASIQNPNYGYDEIKSENTITIIDAYKPANITGLGVSSIGNGILKATWNEAAEDGRMYYYVNAYDSNGNLVPGFTGLKTDKNSILLGGSYTGIDASGSKINYNFETGKSYKIGITPVKVRTADEDETIHIGNEVLSALTLNRTPTLPNIEISYDKEFKTKDGKKYFGSNAVKVNFSSTEVVDTDVYLDGDYFASFNNLSSFALPLEFIDGEHMLEFMSKNVYGDKNDRTVSFIIDTTSPELMIDSPTGSVITNDGSVLVKGIVESGADVYVGETKVDIGGDGSFETTYNMNLGKLKEQITIKAKDLVGNETIYNTEIINGTMKPIAKISILNAQNKIYTGSTTVMNVKGTDQDGKEVEIDNSDLEFSILSGENIASINEKGELLAYDPGNLAVSVSYSLTDDYKVEDAIEFTVDTGIDHVSILPEISELEVDKSVSLSLIGATKYNEVNLSNSNVTYTITKGNEYVSLTGNTLKAIKPGSVTVRAYFEDDVKNATATIDIEIVGKEPQVIDDTNYEPNTNNNVVSTDFKEAKEIPLVDEILSRVWANLIEKEKNLEITSVREIRNDLDVKITLPEVGKLEIPKGTLSEKDEFLTGIIKEGEKIVDNTQYKLNGDILELTFKNAGGILQKPIKLTFNINESKVSDKKRLGVYVYNEIFKKWQYLGGEIDEVNKQISLELNHLSKYSVMEDILNDQYMDITNNWSKNYVKSLSSLDVVEGEYSGGYRYYSPNRELSRLELAALAVRVYEKMYPEKINAATNKENVFIDFEEIPDWGKEYATKAYKYGLVYGIECEDGKTYFNPKGKTTRAEAMTIISRAIGGEVQGSIKFTDSDTIPSWAKGHIQKLAALGLVEGYSDGSIKPTKSINRAEIAKMIYCWIENRDIELKQANK